MAAPGTRFMHFNKANIKCLLINILGHDIIHDYGPSMVDRWESNTTIVTQFSADRFTMMGGRGMIGGSNRIIIQNPDLNGNAKPVENQILSPDNANRAVENLKTDGEYSKYKLIKDVKKEFNKNHYKYIYVLISPPIGFKKRYTTYGIFIPPSLKVGAEDRKARTQVEQERLEQERLEQERLEQERLEQLSTAIYSQVRINEGIITDQIGNAMLFSFFGKVMYYLYLKQTLINIDAAVADDNIPNDNPQAAQGGAINRRDREFYNHLNDSIKNAIKVLARQKMPVPQDANGMAVENPIWNGTDVELLAHERWGTILSEITSLFRNGLNIFDAQLFDVSDNMYQENFVNNGQQIIPRDIFQNVQDSFSLYVRNLAPGHAGYNQELNYNPPAGQPPYNLPHITYTHFFELFDAFTNDNKNLRYRIPAQGANSAYDVVIDGAGKIDGIIMNSYGLTASNQQQFGESLLPLQQQYQNLNIDALIASARNPQVVNGGGKKYINQSGGADPVLTRAQSEELIGEIGQLLNSIVTINNNQYSIHAANAANLSLEIFREIVRQYLQYLNAADADIPACVAQSMAPLVYNAGAPVVAQSGYYALITLLRNQFNEIFLNAANIGVRPAQPSKSAAMFNDWKMFSDIKINRLRNLPNEENFIKTFYLRISNLLDTYRVIVSKDIDLQRQAQAKLDADARNALLGNLTAADKAVLGDFCTFMARAALTCTDIIDTSGIVKLPNVWTQHPNNAARPAALTNYYTTKNLNVAAQAALPPSFNSVANWGAGIDSIEARRNVPPPLAAGVVAAGGVNNYYLSSNGGLRQSGSQALAKETSILLYIAGYAGYGIQGNVDRNIISDTNYWLGWNDVSSASLDDVLIQFIRDGLGAYNFPAIETADRILQANNMFCNWNLNTLRKYIINNAAGSRPGGAKPQEFCPYSSILDGMSMCGWNSSNGSGRESGNMDFYYIGATDFSSILNNNLATAATINTTSYYRGRSTLTGIDAGLIADNIAIELNIRPNDNWPFQPVNVNVTTNISSNNNLDAKVVLGNTLKNYITRIIGGPIPGAPNAPALHQTSLDVIFNTGTLLHSGMGMASNSTKSGIFTRLFQYYNDVQIAYAVAAVAVAAGNAGAALPAEPVSAASFANFYQDWVYKEITKKGIGDIFQEVNAMCKYGGYSLIRPNNVAAGAAAAYNANRGTYRVSSNRIISYLESPATQATAANFAMADDNTRIIVNAGAAPNPTGDQLRLFIAEDRPSGFRAGFVRKFGRGADINERASGGYFDGTAQNSFIVRPHNMNFCTNVAQPAAGGGSKQNRKTRKHKKIVKTKKNMKMRKGRKTRVRGIPIKRMKQNVPRKRITKKVK